MIDHQQPSSGRLARWCLSVAVAATALATATACAGAGAAVGAGATARAGTTAGRSPARSSRPASATTLDVPGGSTGPGGGSAPAPRKPLAGMVVGIDPGHNGRNGTDPAFLDHQVWNGREWEDCDTTGTQTDGGYTEALFTFRVASFLRADLRRDGARVVMTRKNNHGLGPCVNRRSQIINHAHARVAVDIHADGGPPGGRGFAILEPVADGPNDHVIGSSARLGRAIRRALLSGTSMPVSTYDGVNGVNHRDDLAGLNLTRVPKVLIECGNMRNYTDAALLVSTRFQRDLARAFEAAIIAFLHRH